MMSPQEVNKEITYTIRYYMETTLYKNTEATIQGFWLDITKKYEFCSYQSMLNKMSAKTAFTPYELWCIENTLGLPFGYIMKQSLWED